MRSRSNAAKTGSARERLVAAGRKLFGDTPYDQVAIDDITRAAGVAHGLLFHYFKSKLDFYLHVYHIDREEMLRRRILATQNGTPDERLRAFISFHMDHLKATRWSHIFLLRGGAPASLVAEAEISRMAGVRQILEFFSPEPPTKEELVLGRAWLGLQGEILLVWLQDNSLNRAAVLETCVELFYEVMGRVNVLSQGKTAARSAKPKPAVGERTARRFERPPVTASD